jgi:hypothetical protein
VDKLSFVELKALLKQLQDLLKDTNLKGTERAIAEREVRKVTHEIEIRKHD